MPAGLDGNPNPIRSAERDALLGEIAQEAAANERRPTCVAIDGAPGSGKSTFADELAARISSLARPVVRSTTDSFHNPRSIRARHGLASAASYYEDSHNLDVLRSDLLEPIRARRPFRVAHFDEPSDAAEPVVWHPPEDELVLVFDGLFLQRPELAPYWDLSIVLVADERRDRAFEAWSSQADADDVDFAIKRYRDGWELYLETCRPLQHSDWIVDNDDFARPYRVT